MANKRDLKRDMRIIADNLADDIYALKRSALSDAEREKAKELINRIAALESKGVKKVSEAVKSVKEKEKASAFFAKLRREFNEDVALIEAEIKKLVH